MTIQIPQSKTKEFFESSKKEYFDFNPKVNLTNMTNLLMATSTSSNANEISEETIEEKTYPG